MFHRRGRVGERFHTDGGCVGENGFTDGGASVRGFTPTGSCPSADGRSFGFLARVCSMNPYSTTPTPTWSSQFEAWYSQARQRRQKHCGATRLATRIAAMVCRFEEAVVGTCLSKDRATATRDGAGLPNTPFVWEQGAWPIFQSCDNSALRGLWRISEGLLKGLFEGKLSY